MTKFLGIDYGSSKIGLALADSQTKISLPWKIVAEPFFFDHLPEWLKEEEITEIIVGWPLNLAGQESQQAEQVQKFIDKLGSHTDKPVIKEDERLTTAQAKKTSVKNDDSVAAMYLLQSYLDRHG